MSNPPANWYPDPRGEAELRYWDGNQWTEHTHSGQPQAAPAQPPPAQAPPPAAPAPVGPPAAGTPTAAGTAPGYQQPGYQQAARGPAGPGDGKKGGSKLPIIIGGALAAIAVVVVLVLVLAGGGDDGGGEEAKVEDAATATLTGTEAEDCEEGVTSEFVQKYTGQTGSDGVEACKELSRQEPLKEVEIKDVKITGDKATLTAIPGDGSSEGEEIEVSMVKEGDDWKIDDFDRPKIAQGSEAERAIINTVLNFGSSEGVKACDYMSYAGLQRLGGRSGCESSFKEGQPANYQPQDAQINGKTATLVVDETRQDKTIKFTLSRELGQWKIDSFEAQ